MLTSIIASIESESDRQFIEDIYLHYRGPMYRKALSILRNPHDADDAVETAMLKLIDRIDLLRGCNPGSLRSYLLSCVRNEAIRQLSREGKFYCGDAEKIFSVLPDDGEDVDAKLLYRDQVQSLVRALQSLPERERLVLRMKYYERMSDAEIGALLNIKSSTVRSTIVRGRRKAFDLLKQEEAR